MPTVPRPKFLHRPSKNGVKKPDRPLLEIDKYRLDEEAEGQPGLYLFWADKLAKAELRLAEAKAELDLTRAELSRDIRGRWVEFEPGKPTNEAVEIRIFVNKEYQAAVRAVNDAKYDVDHCKAVVRGAEHRKSMIESLVYLQGQGYFAGRLKLPGNAGKRISDQRAFGRDE